MEKGVNRLGNLNKSAKERLAKMPDRDIEDLEELREPLTKIILELRPRIEKGVYGIIVGDDTSGRIPTYILAQTIKTLYENKKMLPPIVRFFTNRQDGLDNHLRNIKERLKADGRSPKRGLLVTEYISSGRTIRPMVEALKKNGIPVDIAAVSMDTGSDGKDVARYLHCPVIDGGKRGNIGIMDARMLSGVRKTDASFFATPYETAYTEQGAERIRMTRVLGQSIAGKIVRKYNSEKNDG